MLDDLIYVTTIIYDEQKYKVYRRKNSKGYFLSIILGEEEIVLNDEQNDVIGKKIFSEGDKLYFRNLQIYRKLGILLLTSGIVITSFNTQAFAKENDYSLERKSPYLELVNVHELMALSDELIVIINQYNLQSIVDKIVSNQDDFMRLYYSVIENEWIPEKYYADILKSFEYLVDNSQHFDLREKIDKLKEVRIRETEYNPEAKQYGSFTVMRVFRDEVEVNVPLISMHVDDSSIFIHELYHLYNSDKNFKNFTGYLWDGNKFYKNTPENVAALEGVNFVELDFSARSLYEAKPEIDAMKTSNKEDGVYQRERDVYRLFELVLGTEKMDYYFHNDEKLAPFLNDLKEIGYSLDEIITLFQRCDLIHLASQDVNIDVTTFEVIVDMINIYTKLSGKVWYDDLQLREYICGMIENSNVDLINSEYPEHPVLSVWKSRKLG